MTNAERIRSMTDKELAAFLYTDYTHTYCRPTKECLDIKNNEDVPCYECIAKWLKEEAK